MISAARATIFGPLLRLDLQTFPGKSRSGAEAAAEFCRMKIDFRLEATKLQLLLAFFLTISTGGPQSCTLASEARWQPPQVVRIELSRPVETSTPTETLR
jgi:hypothetical protein